MCEKNYRAFHSGIMHEPFHILEFFNPVDSGTFPAETIFLESTGFKDRNGKEIYEGDIISSIPYLQTEKKEKIIAQVLFREDLGRWNAEAIGEFEGETNHLFEVCKAAHQTEIIGNIYETPELLKVKTDSPCVS